MKSLEARARDVLSLIGSFRNMLQPVNRLPPEILSRIFQDVSHQFACYTPPIIVLTHVCRYWRKFLILTPGNWTTISSQSEGLMALSLERSKAAPLSLSLRMNEIGDIPGFSDLIMPHIQKTKTLRINDVSPVEEITQKLPGFPQSMPNLQSLELLMASGITLSTHLDYFPIT